MSPRQIRTAIVAMTVITAPVMLGIDLLVRPFTFGLQPEEVQEFLAEATGWVAWRVMPLPLLGGLVALWAYPRLLAWQLRGAAQTGTSADSAELLAVMMALSMPQIPALLCDLCLMFGAPLEPGVVAATLATASVLAVALRASRTPRAGG